ncbi:FkbM family methyltransferase [Stappia stellulata]|uniref:FkbM family methyltransferase n=1 Tax=Stappia stellulata TaxID=71235 RepID=UPI0009FDB93D|nr:FkbM family methyltransferase [Stappia stellulata]
MKYDPNLIYDLGLHKGEDTEYYLKRGFRVVSVEADEDLVRRSQVEFREYIEDGRLVIIHGAISDAAEDWITFYKNPKVSVWGTVVKSWAERNSNLGADSVEVTVRVVKLKRLFEDYGIPYYLKIDIEGMDLFALKTLLLCAERPKYVSIESEKVDFDKLIEEFKVLEELGFDSFFLVEQSGVSKQKIPENSTEGKMIKFEFKQGSSGLFGSDLGDAWISKEEAVDRYRDVFRMYRIFGDRSLFTKVYPLRVAKGILQKLMRKQIPGWYDTHARLRD